MGEGNQIKTGLRVIFLFILSKEHWSKVLARVATFVSFMDSVTENYGRILQQMDLDQRGFDTWQTRISRVDALGLDVSLLNLDGTTSLRENRCDFAIYFEVFLKSNRALTEFRPGTEARWLPFLQRTASRPSFFSLAF